MTKISTYDALEWVKSILALGKDTFCMAHLPEHLQEKRYLLWAKQKRFIYEIGKTRVRYAGNDVKIWAIHPDVPNITNITNIKMRKI